MNYSTDYKPKIQREPLKTDECTKNPDAYKPRPEYPPASEKAWEHQIMQIDGVKMVDPRRFCDTCEIELTETNSKNGVTHCFKCLGVTHSRLRWLES